MQLSLIIRASTDRGNVACKTFKIVDCYYSSTAAKKLKKFLDSQVPLDLRSHRYHFVRIVNTLDAQPQAAEAKTKDLILGMFDQLRREPIDEELGIAAGLDAPVAARVEYVRHAFRGGGE